MNTRLTVPVTTSRVTASDRRLQLGIDDYAIAHVPCAPFVVAGTRHVEQSAHALHSVLRSFDVNECVLHGDFFAKITTIFGNVTVFLDRCNLPPKPAPLFLERTIDDGFRRCAQRFSPVLQVAMADITFSSTLRRQLLASRDPANPFQLELIAINPASLSDLTWRSALRRPTSNYPYNDDKLNHHRAYVFR